jgi:hypothetical protein
VHRRRSPVTSEKGQIPLLSVEPNYADKSKFHPRIRHGGPERAQRYTSILSVTSALYGGGWSTPRPGRFTPGKGTRYPFAPTGIRSWDCRARSQSLNRLHYTTLHYNTLHYTTLFRATTESVVHPIFEPDYEIWFGFRHAVLKCAYYDEYRSSRNPPNINSTQQRQKPSEMTEENALPVPRIEPK